MVSLWCTHQKCTYRSYNPFSLVKEFICIVALTWYESSRRPFPRTIKSQRHIRVLAWCLLARFVHRWYVWPNIGQTTKNQRSSAYLWSEHLCVREPLWLIVSCSTRCLDGYTQRAGIISHASIRSAFSGNLLRCQQLGLWHAHCTWIWQG
jgi:hypothetical protein